MKTNTKKYTHLLMGSLLCLSIAGCSSAKTQADAEETAVTENIPAETAESAGTADNTQENTSKDNSSEKEVTAVNTASGGALDTAEMFSERDLTETADLSEAVTYTVSDGQDISITEEGVYVLKGSAKDVTVTVEADDSAKVQIVLDGVTIENTDFPCIYVKSADKVFVTTTDSTNTLSVTGTFVSDDTVNTDAVIFSKDDLVLNGTGTLEINSTDNGISGKDDVKVTGGTLAITCAEDAIEAHDSVRIADGNITINAQEDGIHAEDDDDDTVGYVYICGGTLDIDAGDDAIHATTVLQIDGGTVTIDAAEALEGTYIQINDGSLTLKASDDGINAAHKSSAYTPVIEINGGELNITMGAGDTDALDSNGNLYINGGTVNISAQFAFDFDGKGELNGGTVYVNGQQVTTISNSMMGGGMMGGFGGRPGEGEMPENGFGGEMPENGFGGGMQHGPHGGH